jgi:pimeloyl-ACP methyl ester carboxylesterase
LHFETHGSRANPAILMGSHFYPTRALNDDSFTGRWIEQLQDEFFLLVADYPRGIGRTGNPQGLAYHPDIAAQEYLLIADAAGLDRFGWLGYSFGGAMGVQVACRSSRVTALAVGGFPPLNAPFQRILAMATDMAANPPTLPESIAPGVLATTVGFYAPLVIWPEREEIVKLTMPRMVFMGDQDGEGPDPTSAPLAAHLRAAEGELRALGWKVRWLEGRDHVSAIHPDASFAAVQQFFRDALRPQ